MAVVSGCSADVTRLNLPIFGPADDAKLGYSAPAGDTTASIAPIPQVPVQGASLAAPGLNPRPSAISNISSQPLSAPSAVSASSPLRPQGVPPAAVQQTAATVTRGTSGTGAQIQVAPRDTLYGLSRRYGVSQGAIMSANNLTGPSDLKAGQRLVIPSANSSPNAGSANAGSSARAVAQTASPSRTAQRAGSVHTVAPGDTVYSIARRYQVTPGQLAQQNNLASPNQLMVGQRLQIPSDDGRMQVASLSQTAVPTSRPRPQGTALPSTANSAPPAPASTPSPASTAQAPASAPQPAEQPTQVASRQPAATATSGSQPLQRRALPDPLPMTSSKFRWPVRGRIISEFGSKSGGARNDGINIEVPMGTSVKAAENGVVAYAGNELQGFGNLILIRHADDWVTAYAHNSEILVRRGDVIQRGQIIAKAGQTGSVTKPQLHFEIRKGSRPVDPTTRMAGN
jgi:murein DD-endopeptidase MepM/ murein hydrolase activator NlpD